jgi:hypothetical protein
MDERASVRLVADAIYLDKVLRARMQDPVRKLQDGFALFERGLELTKLDVIRQIGTADPQAVQKALQQRFDRVRRVREATLYRVCDQSSTAPPS